MAGPYSWGPNPRHITAVVSSHPYGPALQFRGRIAGAPTPDIWGVAGRRLQAGGGRCA
eukprot:gene21856-biopygen16211